MAEVKEKASGGDPDKGEFGKESPGGGRTGQLGRGWWGTTSGPLRAPPPSGASSPHFGGCFPTCPTAVRVKGDYGVS